MSKRTIAFAAFASLAAMFGATSQAQTSPGITNIMVLAEDQDDSSIRASSDVHYRITAELREQMRQYGYEILDTDAVLARLRYNRIPDRTGRLEKIRFAPDACTNGDSTTCPRVLVFVKARAGTRSTGFGRTADVRLQGDMVDVANGSSLGNWQPVRDAFTAPAQCSEFCLEEVIGDNAFNIAADLGDVLRIKLDDALNVQINGFGSASSAQADIRTEYVITFRNFSTGEMLSMLDIMETQFPGNPKVGDYEGSRSARIQNYSSLLDSAELERLFYDVLLDLGLSEEEFRMTTREGRNIEIQKVIFGTGR